MQNEHLTKGFDKFWRSLKPEHQRSTNLFVARQAFIAGRKVGKPTEKPSLVPAVYRFQAGKWRVTVKARSLTEARSEARKVLDRRAQKLGATPPAGGWLLTQLRYEI
jgi:hypothetical protein